MNGFFANEANEKEEIKQVIKNLTDNFGNYQSQIKEIDDLLRKYNYNNAKLDNLLEEWKKITNYDPLWAEKVDKTSTKITFVPLKYEKLNNGY